MLYFIIEKHKRKKNCSRSIKVNSRKCTEKKFREREMEISKRRAMKMSMGVTLIQHGRKILKYSFSDGMSVSAIILVTDLKVKLKTLIRLKTVSIVYTQYNEYHRSSHSIPLLERIERRYFVK